MRLLAIILASLLATGCIGGDATDAQTVAGASLDPAVIADPTLPADGVRPATPLAAPVWTVGDAWAVQSGEQGSEAASFVVVTAASPDSYTLATTSDQMASYDAMFDVSYIGKIRALDLAGVQGEEIVKYFDFPLSEGKAWTTKWDGSDVALVAKQTARGFDITGTRDGEPYVTYDFVPELKWWSHLTFAAGYGVKVDRFVAAWAGEVATATASIVFEMGPGAPVASPGSGAFTIDEGQTMAMLTIHVGGAAWARVLRLFDPSGMPHKTTTPDFQVNDAAGAEGADFYQEELPPTPGEWRIAAPAVHDPDGAGYVVVHQVAVTKTAFP